MNKTFAVALTIPDNEAFTALAALRRLGLPLGGVRRADIWSFEVDAAEAAGLPQTLATVETVFNPNKHELTERAGAHPLAGEVWIVPQDEGGAVRVGGRALAGVREVRRAVAWQLFEVSGALATPELLDRAIETFLCNPAFQKAITIRKVPR